jgi:Spy/CpxP family protein refolding chaperone
MKGFMTLLAATVLAVSSTVSAQPGWQARRGSDQPGRHQADKPGFGRGMGMGHGLPGPGMLLQVADEISLTEAQKEKLEQMMVDFSLEKVDLRAELEKAQIKLQALMRDDKARETEVNAAIDDATRLKGELQKMRYRHHKEIRSLLTDKQIDRLKELRKEKQGKRKGAHPGMKSGMGHGSPGIGFDFDPEPDSGI